MTKLTTPWTDRADLRHPDPAKIPLSEYPRPTMVRDEYQILNGVWNYRIDREGGRTGRFDGQILVPFSPETALSGVERILQPGSAGSTYVISFPDGLTVRMRLPRR